MSGPKTAMVEYPAAAAVSGVALSAVVVSAMALREAYKIAGELSEINEQREDRDRARLQLADLAALNRIEAEATRRINSRKNAEIAAGRLLQQRESVARLLPDLAAQLPALPTVPGENDDELGWHNYERACIAAMTAVDGLLAKTTRAVNLTTTGRAALPALDASLQVYFLERQRNPALSAVEAADFAETAGRILDRLDRRLMVVTPPVLAQLAREIVLAPDRDRADALASELRLQVQRANEAAAAEKLREEREAAAFVLEASLKDLGYVVEDIGETLFVEGGVVHFQKRGWGDYFVRLRIDAAKSSANFNVVRSGLPSEGEQRRADHLAEDRWCAEMPRLFDTLRSRGLNLTLQRHIAAGQLPVQVVDPAALPQVAKDDARTLHKPQLQARPLG